jgi:hypothetical protein
MLSIFAIFSSFLLNVSTTTTIPAQTDHILVKTNSDGFAILTPDGFYMGAQQSLSEFISYKDSTRVNTNNALKDFKISYIGETPYLLSPMDGFVYVFKDSLLTRIDRDLRQANDYQPLYFSHQNQLYTIGGKIIFNNKNSLKVFNWDSSTWKFIPTSGEIPPGIKNALYQIIDDQLWVFHANEVDENLDEKYIQNSYSLDLNTLKWKKQGIINPSFIINTQNKDLKSVATEKGIVVYNEQNQTSFVVDVKTNQLIKNNISNQLEISSNAINIDQNQWIYTSESNANNLRVNQSELSPYSESEYFIRNQSLFEGKVKEFSSLGLFLLFSFIGYIFISRKKFKLTPEGLSNGLKKMPLTEEEVKFLSILAQNKIVLNNEAMDIVLDPNTTYDANIKRKNNLVSKIERKLKKTFNEVLFSRERYKDDMRHTAFYLKNGFSIKLLESIDE